MKVKFEYSEELAAINEKLLDMPRQLEDSEDKVLRKIGNAVKKNVVRFLHDSDVETRARWFLRPIMTEAGHTFT